MQTQVGGMQGQIDSMKAQMLTKDEFNVAIANLVTKDEFNTSTSKLQATIRRETGDLGESIASLTGMVAKEFDNLTITRLKAGHIKTARPRAAEGD